MELTWITLLVAIIAALPGIYAIWRQRRKGDAEAAEIIQRAAGEMVASSEARISKIQADILVIRQENFEVKLEVTKTRVELVSTRQELIDTRKELIATRQELIDTRKELVVTRQLLSDARLRLGDKVSDENGLTSRTRG